MAAYYLQSVRRIGFLAQYVENLPATELGVDSAIGEQVEKYPVGCDA